MTREEQLDALVREALDKIGEVRHSDRRYSYGDNSGMSLYQFEEWFRAEFIRTQAP